MKKQEILKLCESIKSKYIKNIDDLNRDSIMPILEATGLIPRRNESPASTPVSRSSRPDLMELDSKSDGGKKMYDISKKEINPPVSDKKEETKKEPEPVPVKKVDNSESKKTEIKKEDQKPKEEIAKKETTKTLVDKSHGYPEIQLNEEFKTADETVLDGLLNKSEVDQIINAKDENKIELFRNLLFCKESDIGKGDKYLCFNSNKGNGSVLTKGEVPVSYIDAYYSTRGSISRPDGEEKYAVLGAKNSGSGELIEYISLNDSPDKYVVFIKINDNEHIMILDKTEYNLLFHPVS